MEKIRGNRFWNRAVIFGLDLLVSVASTLVTLLLANALLPQENIGSRLFLCWLPGTLLFTGLFFALLRTHCAIIRYANVRSLARPAVAVLCKILSLLLLFAALPWVSLTPWLSVALLVDGLLTFVLLVVLRIAMVVVYNYLKEQDDAKGEEQQQLLIYGTGDESVSLVSRLQGSPRYRVIGFITCDSAFDSYTISGQRIYKFRDEGSVTSLKEKLGLAGVIFANEKDARAEKDNLMKFCAETGLKVWIAPSIKERGEGALSPIREVKIEDLLGREEIKVSIEEIKANFRDKVVMVTGAAGSIGSELCRQLASFGVKQLILYDNAETPMHTLRLEFDDKNNALKARGEKQLDFVPVIGDVRQKARLDYAFRKWKPEVVFHAAAYKHVPLMEDNPCEAVLVNAVGTRYVADKCIEYGVEKMVMISTDKAVNPTNIMGCTKRLAEIYVQALSLAVEDGKQAGKTKFVTTRFGNVLGSNGSVIPRFREQIAKGGPVTVTDPNITRYFMTIPEACRLVMEAATLGETNRIFVFDMGESVKIKDLAVRMIELAGLVPDKDIKIEYSGLRPGEKLYEELLSNDENTTPTHHHRIRIAKVREYAYPEAQTLADQLEELSRKVEIPDMVKLMKRTVPEFKSKNSKYEKYDTEIEGGGNGSEGKLEK